jgi:hypothetical protein
MVFGCVLATLATPRALQQPDVIRVWRIGSPYQGDTPGTAVPSRVANALQNGNARLQVEVMPAADLAPRLSTAIDSGSPPDVLVIDNYGLIRGITTSLGTFVGIEQNARVRDQLVRVTGSLDGLLGPQRGWTFLLSRSTNHAGARRMALRTPDCGNTGPVAQTDELTETVPDIVRAYLRGNTNTLEGHSDADRVTVVNPTADRAAMLDIRVCGMWGNDRLRFVSARASYEAATAIGHVPVLLVFRKPSMRWQLLVASRDPISNGEFLRNLSALESMLESDGRPFRIVQPAGLVSPVNGAFPEAAQDKGQRFGDFVWETAASRNVVANIAEFAYKDDARLFVTLSPGGTQRISSGSLWHTRSEWKWRVWSVNRVGDVAFSESRTFSH